MRIADPLEAPLARQALRAHEFWQRNGFEADLVLLNEYPGGYIQPVQDELERLVVSSHAHNMLNKPGGVFVKRADVMPEADIVLLKSVARVVLVGSRGMLDAQLDREVPPLPLPTAKKFPRTVSRYLLSRQRRLQDRQFPATSPPTDANTLSRWLRASRHLCPGATCSPTIASAAWSPKAVWPLPGPRTAGKTASHPGRTTRYHPPRR